VQPCTTLKFLIIFVFNIYTFMKPQQLTTQDRFTLALHATWSVLRDPVLTKIYMRQWKRYLSRLGKSLLPGDQLPTLYGYIFGIMYKEL
jgi:hypothetical protein